MLGLGNNLAGGTGTLWSPYSISSLLHYYSFDTGQTITDIDDVDHVTTWADQKGSNDASAEDQDTSGGVDAVEAPKYSSGSVLFNNTNDWLKFDSALELGAFSMYIRMESNDVAGDVIVENTDSSEFWKIQSTGGGPPAVTEARIKIDSERNDYTFSPLSVDTKFNIGVERTSAGVIMMYVNGSSTTLAGSNDGTVNIDNTTLFNRIGAPVVTCKVYEIVICSDALSAFDRANLNTYLNLI